MNIKIIKCKGDIIEDYRIVDCDDWEVEGRHISIYKNKKQVCHYPARYFAIEEIDEYIK
jgi:hypothetical protein